MYKQTAHTDERSYLAEFLVARGGDGHPLEPVQEHHHFLEGRPDHGHHLKTAPRLQQPALGPHASTALPRASYCSLPLSTARQLTRPELT